MAGIDKLFSLAKSQGITVPEFVKFLASPAGYMLAKAFDEIEKQTNLPQGILSLAQNPTNAATNYVQTQAQNVLLDQNNISKIESIINELQGTDPNKANYLGPQTEDSPVSSKNTTDLLSILNQYQNPESEIKYQSPESEFNNTSNFTNTNSANFVGPTTQLNTDNNPYSENLINFLEMMGQYKQPETSSNTEVASQNNSDINFTSNTETPIDFGGTMDYSNILDFSGMDFSGMDFGGGGGGDRGDFDYSANAMAKGGQILRGKR